MELSFLSQGNRLMPLTPPAGLFDSPSNRQGLKDTVDQLTRGSDPSPTPPLRGDGLSGSPFPTREGGWGVRFSEFANSILKSLANSPSRLKTTQLLILSPLKRTVAVRQGFQPLADERFKTIEQSCPNRGRTVSHQLATCCQLTSMLPATPGAFFLDAIAFPQVMTHG